MRDYCTLPSDKEELGRVIEAHCQREEQNMLVWRTTRLLAWYYLRGFRRFTVFNEHNGQVLGEYTDSNGNFQFQTAELLAAINEVSGRIASMDVRPWVTRSSLSLSSIRSRSMMQIILSAVTNLDQLNEVKRNVAWNFALLGSCGLSGQVDDHPLIGLSADIEVVHPREVLPFPSVGQDITKATGRVRSRYVSLDYLERTLKKKFTDAALDKMEVYEKEHGAALEFGDETTMGGASNPQPIMAKSGTLGAYGGMGSVQAGQMRAVKVRELWQVGSRGRCVRYVLTSGQEVLLDSGDLSNFEVYPSLQFARFMENGTFHGAGMFDLLFGYGLQHEKLLADLYSNVHTADRYGVVVMPGSQMNLRVGLTDVGRGLRVLPWEPDPLQEGFRPFAIQPTNSGDFPGKVAAMTKDLFDRINPIRDLIREKGRVDSAQGLQFLDEQINRAMTNPTMGFQSLWGGLYRSIGQQAVAKLVSSKQALPITELSLDLAGVVIDPENDTVSFSENPLPVVSRLSFGVRDLNPKSEVARKAEAVSLAEKRAAMGRPDWDAFVLFALKEGLDFAMWVEEEKAAHETVVRDLLILFNDGQTPGEVVLTPHTSKPEIMLRETTAFLASPVVKRASPSVINALKHYRDTLLSYMGLVLPAAVPNPEDAAMLAQSAPLALPPGASPNQPGGGSPPQGPPG